MNQGTEQIADPFQVNRAAFGTLDYPLQRSPKAVSRDRSAVDGPATLLGKWRIEQGQLTVNWTITPKPPSRAV